MYNDMYNERVIEARYTDEYFEVVREELSKDTKEDVSGGDWFELELPNDFVLETIYELNNERNGWKDQMFEDLKDVIPEILKFKKIAMDVLGNDFGLTELYNKAMDEIKRFEGELKKGTKAGTGTESERCSECTTTMMETER